MSEKKSQIVYSNVNVVKVYDNPILYIDNEFHIEYKLGNILLKNNNNNSLINCISLGRSSKDRLFSSVPLTERLFRYEPRYIDRLYDMTFVLSEQGTLSTIDFQKSERKNIFTYSVGTKNPLHFCSYKRNERQEIVFGDYGGHDDNGNVGIYKYAENGVEEIAFIEGNRINHIHLVEYDEFRDCFWIFTGDTDEGSGIWKLDYNNQTPEPIVIGSQQYRSCVAYIGKDTILYATDSPIEMNHIYKLDIYTRKLTVLADLPGSCIYGKKIETNKNEYEYLFATAVEPDSTLSRIRYRLTRKLGAGIQDNYSHLVAGNIERGFIEIWKTKKDWLPLWLFQFGNIRFPEQRIKDYIYFCPQSSLDKGTYRIKMI